MANLHQLAPHITPSYYTSPFNGLFSRTTWLSRYQKGQTNLDLNEARGDGVLGRQWHQLDHILCKQSAPRSRQLTTPTPRHSIFTGRMLFLTPNQQCQSTESKVTPTKRRTIRYDTRCYFNARSKADTSQLNLPHGTDN